MRYTMEIRTIIKTIPIFDFKYEFYEESLKSNFEEKFINHFYFREIGFETIARFKRQLNTKLNEIMPYYVELYKTMLKSKNIDFLVNKDLVEIYEKNIQENANSNENTSNMSNNVNSETFNSNMKTLDKTLDTPQGSIENLDNYLSGASKGENSTINKNNSNSTTNIDTTNNIDSNRKQIETFKNTSKGNIGITSSAELLEKWRKTIINIDMLIISDLECLFMGLY